MRPAPLASLLSGRSTTTVVSLGVDSAFACIKVAMPPITDGKVIRFHLQVLHGINVKESLGKKERTLALGSRLFGVSLDNVPRRCVPEFGLVPW